MKKRLLCPAIPQPNSPVTLSENEAHHATHVLRLRDGEQVDAIDGNGNRAIARLRTTEGPVRLEYLESDPDSGGVKTRNWVSPICLEMAVLKGSAMEWVVEKSVELGIRSFQPVLTAHTVVQMKSKSPEAFQDRWQRIADQALKQCGRSGRMEVCRPVSLETLLVGRVSQTQEGSRLWCDEASREEAPYLLNWLQTHVSHLDRVLKVLVGPEGGWSVTEREMLMLSSPPATSSTIRIQLGPHILRAETAALFAISLASAHTFRLASTQ